MIRLLYIFAFFFFSSCLAFAEQVEAPLAATMTSLADITTSHVGYSVVVKGIITAHDPADEKLPHRIRVLDDKGSIWMAIPKEVWAGIPFRDDIEQGTLLTCVIKIEQAQGVLSGRLESPENVRLGPVPATVFNEPSSNRSPKSGSSAVATLFLAMTAAFAIAYAYHWRSDVLLARAEHSRNERALLDRQSHLEKLLGAGPVIFFTLEVIQGRNFHVSFVSDNLTTLFGYERSDPSQPGWWEENLHPEDRNYALSCQQKLIETNQIEIIYRFRNNDGVYRWIQDKRRLLRDQADLPREVVGYWMDVSELKQGIRLRETFTTLGAKLSAVTNAKNAARVVLTTAAQLFGWDKAAVAIFSQQDGQFDSLLDLEEKDGKRRETSPPHEGAPLWDVAHEVLSDGAKLVLRTVSPDEDTTEEASLAPSMMLAPVQRSNKSFGVIVIQSNIHQHYDEEDLQVLQVLANYCSAALDRTFAEENRKKAEEALRESEERYALAMQGANDAIWDWDLRTNLTYFSPRWKTMLGYSEDEITKHPLEWLKRVHPEDLERVKVELEGHVSGKTAQLEIEHRVSHKDGSYRWMLIRGVAVRDHHGTATRMAGSMTDISVRKAAEAQLHHGAYHDALTGLPNRLLFLDHLRRSIARAQRRDDTLFAVLFLDLDRFKIVNDSLGHLIGDQLLINVARRLEACVRPEDTVARLGGDEFTVLLQDIAGESDATRIADRIQEELIKPVNLSGHEVYTTVSIGIAFSSTRYDVAEDMLRDADAAMYRAKSLGKARHAMFDTAMHSRAMALLQLEADLRRAIEREELRVYYQPLIALDNGQVVGCEALLRWIHPERGMLMPAEFIPIAEETGLIIPLGWWVMRTACHQVRKWHLIQQPAEKPLTIAVNVSRKQFSEADFVEKLQKILQEVELDGACLILEITEGVAIENADFLTAMLTRLKELKVQVHIDDFGTGYSSLSYLHQFPIDTLKIDRSFVAGITPGGGHRDIVKAIVTLAANLGLGVIAEGVETPEQLSTLKGMNCKYTQGFYFSKPLDSENATDYILTHQAQVQTG